MLPRSTLSPKRRSQLRALWWVLAGAVAALSLAPGSAAPVRWLDAAGWSDKALHAAGYVPLAFLPALHERRGRAILLVAAALLLGVLLEFAQASVEGRSFETGDMAANAAGLFIGLLAGLALRSGK